MFQGKTLILVLVTLVLGFVAGFILRPVISPAPQAVVTASLPPNLPAPSEARGTQYFVVHIDEARQVVAGCRDGSVRGGECATAEKAIITVESKERFRRFRGER